MEYKPKCHHEDGEESASQGSMFSEEARDLLSHDENRNHTHSTEGLYRKRLLNRGNTPIILSTLLLIATISFWAHILLLLKGFHCNTTVRKDHFEPDRKINEESHPAIALVLTFIFLVSSRVTFQPHFYYGGPPTNDTDEMRRRLSPRKTSTLNHTKQN